MKQKKSIAMRILAIMLSIFLVSVDVLPVYAQATGAITEQDLISEISEESEAEPVSSEIPEATEAPDKEEETATEPTAEPAQETEFPEITPEETPEITPEATETPVAEEAEPTAEPTKIPETEPEKPLASPEAEVPTPTAEETPIQEMSPTPTAEVPVTGQEMVADNVELVNATVNGLIIEDGVVTGFDEATINLDNIVFPEGVTEIADSIFMRKGVIQVTFPSTLKRIGKNTFAKNSELVKINFAQNSQLEYIGPGAFFQSSITSVTVPASVKTIGSAAFGDCSVLTSATVLSTDVTVDYVQMLAIGSSTLFRHSGPFGGCENLKGITYNGDKIPDHFFQRCRKIESYTVASNVTEIGAKAFESCDSLASVSFEEGSKLEYIGESAFINCRALTSIDIPDSVTVIEKGAFAICTNLASVDLPANLKTMGTATFSLCPSLKSIEIPASLENIEYNYNYSPFYATTGYGSFYKCGPFGVSGVGGPSGVENTSFTSITFEEGTTQIVGNLFAGYGGTGRIVIPDTVTQIGKGAFRSCNNLSGIVIPPSVTVIEEEARVGKTGDTICSSNENFSIYGYKGSTANTYAEDHLLKFNGYDLSFLDASRQVNIGNYAIDLNYCLNKENCEDAVITWSVADPSIANVSAKGYLTGIKPGRTTVTAIAANYGLSATMEVVVCKAIDHQDIVIHEVAKQIYTGKAVKPAVTVYDGETKLTANKDYTVVYTNNINAGKATATIVGKGFYNCSATISFNIMYDMSKTTVTYEFADKENENRYTGKPISVLVTSVQYAGKELENGSYSISYASNVDAGTAIVRVYGNEAMYCTGYKQLTFTIQGVNITDKKKIAMQVKPVIYDNGEELEPEVVVTGIEKEAALVKDKDYKLVYSNNTKPGKGSVMVIGIGGYVGSKILSFTIPKPSFASASASSEKDGQIVIGSISDATYNAAAQKPGITASYNGVALVEGKDYTLKYSNNTNAGTATVTVTGKGAFTGSKKLTFTIKPLPLSEAMGIKVDVPGAAYNNGRPVKPVPTVTHLYGDNKTKTLKAGQDYEKLTDASYSDNTEISTGTAKVKIVGKKNYTGEIEETFAIRYASASSFKVSSIPAQKYVPGQKAEPPVTVKYKGKILPEFSGEVRNYSLEYINADKAGTATVLITGENEFCGVKKVNYKITARSIKSGEITVEVPEENQNLLFTGYAQKPGVLVKDGDKVLAEGTDYVLSYAANTNVGRAKITVKGKGNYNNSRTVNFQIVKWDLSESVIQAADASFLGGKAVKTTITIHKMINGNPVAINPKAVKLTYSNNKALSTQEAKAAIVITPANKKNLSGETNATYMINRGNIAEAVISKVKDQTFKGESIVPQITVKYKGITLKKDVDYVVNYVNNDRKGVATVEIEGIGNYEGSTGTKFIIK